MASDDQQITNVLNVRVNYNDLLNDLDASKHRSSNYYNSKLVVQKLLHIHSSKITGNYSVDFNFTAGKKIVTTYSDNNYSYSSMKIYYGFYIKMNNKFIREFNENGNILMLLIYNKDNKIEQVRSSTFNDRTVDDWGFHDIATNDNIDRISHVIVRIVQFNT